MADDAVNHGAHGNDDLPPTGEQRVDGPAAAAANTNGGYSYEAGASIGPYTLRTPLGRGGFGEVWRAHRRQPDLTVAIKLVRRDKVDRKNLARFSAECQAVALLDHPNIARIHDADVTDDGVPYLAMEYIEGVPLHVYCDRERLSIEARLELVAKVCDAVHHAHTQGIIHRDLKPENVLVSIHASTGPEPKVVDFGIAKAVNKNVRLGDMTITHDLHVMIGTPAYMSPEQAESTQASVDTRTDIFALGVMLYELLTGALPLWDEQLAEAPIETVLQTVRQDRPPPLARFETMPEQQRRDTAYRRGEIDPAELQRQLHGRLHHLPMKAMRIERNKRFSSAAAMAVDIRNYLNDNDFIEAAAEPWWERSMRRVRHHRLAFSAAAIIVLLLIGGVIATSIGLQRALAAEAAADAEAVRARDAESRALMALAAEEQARLDERIARREAEAAAQLAQRRFDEARAMANTIMFELYPLMRDFPGATPAVRFLIEHTEQYLRQLELDAGEDRDLQRDIAVGLVMLGDIQIEEGDFASALENYQRSLQLAERLLAEAPDHAVVARDVMIAIERVGDALRAQGRLDDALTMYSRSMSMTQQRLDQDPNDVSAIRDMLTPLDRIGDIQLERGDLDGAMHTFNSTLDMSQRLLDAQPNHAEFVRNHNVCIVRIGRVHEARGRLDDALEQYRSALATSVRLIEHDPMSTMYHRDAVYILNRLGKVHHRRGAFAYAGDSLQQAREFAMALAQADTASAEAVRDLLIVLTSVGELHTARGELDDAMAQLQYAAEVAAYLQSLDATGVLTQLAMVQLRSAMGDAHLATDDVDSAIDSFREALMHAQQVIALDPASARANMAFVATMQRLGRILTMSGAEDAGEVMQRSRIAAEQLVSDFPQMAEAHETLSAALLHSAQAVIGDGDQARGLTMLSRVLETAQRAVDMNPWSVKAQLDLIEAHLQAALLHRTAGRHETAIQHRQMADTGLQQLSDTEMAVVDAIRQQQLLAQLSEFDETNEPRQ